MASKPVTVGDLIHRVASSCLSNRLPCNYTIRDSVDSDLDEEDDDPFADFADAVSSSDKCRRSPSAADAEDREEEEEKLKIWEEGQQEQRKVADKGVERARDAEALMEEVFDAVSGVRRAYAALQGADCHWDPGKMRVADAVVVAELHHLARLRNRFRHSAAAGHIPRPNPSAPPLREVVASYEATLDDLQRQLQSKQVEVDGLKEKIAAVASRRNGRHHLSKQNGPGGAPTAELFTTCAEQARTATRAFAGHLLHLMCAAGVDVAAATWSLTKISVSSPQLGKHALEAHITCSLLDSFEHESFYLDGSLSSLLDAAAFRQERYSEGRRGFFLRRFFYPSPLTRGVH